MEIPDVEYARAGDVSIAYQVVGEGPIDVVFLPFLSSLWWLWRYPHLVRDGKIAGIAVAMGARVADAAPAGEVLVSQTVNDLVAGSGIAFDERGAHELKGVPGEWRLYGVRAP